VALLVHFYTGLRDLVIGTPVAGRNHPDLKDQVGYYLNALPLRMALNPQQDVAAFLKDNHAYILQAFIHQDYPFDLLVEKLQVNADRGQSPLFDIAFIFQSEAFDGEAHAPMKGIDVKPYGLGLTVSKNDVIFEFSERANKIYGSTEYNTDLFTAQTIEALNANLIAILGALAGPGTRKRIADIRPEVTGEEEAFMNEIMRNLTA
jgi:tyrocidine synthetase-3